MRYDIGMKVFGDWEIIAELGEGSFGKVFRLEKNTYNVKASSALKVLTVPRSASEVREAMSEGCDEESVTEQFHEIVEKLVDEIAVMSELKNHPNIVSVEDYTVIPHQNAIGWDILIRMELLTPLQEYQRKYPMDEKAVRKLASDICEALVFCQEKKLIHRDIKPGNVFTDPLGHFKLGDFGVARTAEKTMSGMSKQGTENYMAPEVYFGREYGPNVDVYSLGVMLYRLMNRNRLPFYPLPPAFPKHSDREQAMYRRLKGEVLPKPCDSSDEFSAIILKACEADPARRYHTAQEMLADLRKKNVDEQNDIDTHTNESLTNYLKGKKVTQELLTEIMSTRKLTPSDMMYLMSMLNAGIEEEDDISFEYDSLKDDSLESDTFSDDTMNDFCDNRIVEVDLDLERDLEVDDFDVTVGIFGDHNNMRSTKKSQVDQIRYVEDPVEEMMDHGSEYDQDLIVLKNEDETDDFDATVSMFGSPSKSAKNKTSKVKVEKKTNVAVAGKDLAELNLTVRTYNSLKRGGIQTVEDLCRLTLTDLRAINNIGPAAREEIITAMSNAGLQLSTGKSQKQIWKENKSRLLVEYWKNNLSRILYEHELVSFERGKSSRNKQYFAPDIPESIWTEAIFHMTEMHTKRFGQTITISDSKIHSARQKEIVCVVDLSLQNEPVCSRGLLMTTEAIYLHLGGSGRETVHPMMIPYNDFASGWFTESGGLLKAKRPILLWTSRTHGNCRYDSTYGHFMNYEGLLACLKELSKKEK